MSAATEEKPFDHVGFIIDLENGDADDEQIVQGFAHLIRTGLAWQLQGSYGRMANSIIERGYISREGVVLKTPGE
jgi:hypothetical protein